MDNEQTTDDLVKGNIGPPPDPVAQASKMFPRPKPLYLGRRREKELKMEFKRVKKGLIKHLKRTNNSIVTNRLCEGEIKLIKEEAISIIERKVNGNTTNIG